MGIQIDQSGKIEDTSKDTVIAYSNDIQRAIVIPKKVKRQIQEVFRAHGETRTFIYHLFSIGIYYLISHIKQATVITIDIEYPGKDQIITKLVDQLLELFGKPKHRIYFSRIGNRPKVHYAAKDVFDKKTQPNKILKREEIEELILKLNSQWAFKRMSSNPGRRSALTTSKIISKFPRKSR